MSLRRLASNIVAAVQAKRDVRYNKFVKVPDVFDAVFDLSGLVETASSLCAYRYIKDVASLGEADSLKELIRQFQAVEDSLIWGQAPGYDVDNVGQKFLDNYCHALLTGPDGPLRCTHPLGSFVLFGPDTHYKDHSHAPNEVYLAITGGGQWRVGDDFWRQLQAGDIIFIPSGTTHAIRTNADPVLTFSFWLEPGNLSAIAI